MSYRHHLEWLSVYHHLRRPVSSGYGLERQFLHHVGSVPQRHGLERLSLRHFLDPMSSRHCVEWNCLLTSLQRLPRRLSLERVSLHQPKRLLRRTILERIGLHLPLRPILHRHRLHKLQQRTDLVQRQPSLRLSQRTQLEWL